jgi:hypothetical protein
MREIIITLDKAEEEHQQKEHNKSDLKLFLRRMLSEKIQNGRQAI